MNRNNNFKIADIEAIRKSYNDLCTTCNSAETCLSLNTKIRPVWFCEQFDDYIPPKVVKNTTKNDQHKTLNNRALESEQNPRQFKGLCINCECRNECKIRIPNGGVWHCEEYR